MTNTITNRQLFFILMLTLTSCGIVVIAKNMAATAGTGAWLVIIISAFVFGLATAVIVSLNIMYEGQMLFDYAPSLISRPGAYVLILYYIAYFLFILVSLICDLTRLLHFDFFPKSPEWSFPLLGLPVFCYVAYKGITNVARLAELIGIVFMFTTLLIHVLMATEGRISRILPLFDSSQINAYLSGFKASVFPFLGIEVLLMVPFAKKGATSPPNPLFFRCLPWERSMCLS